MSKSPPKVLYQVDVDEPAISDVTSGDDEKESAHTIYLGINTPYLAYRRSLKDRRVSVAYCRYSSALELDLLPHAHGPLLTGTFEAR